MQKEKTLPTPVHRMLLPLILISWLAAIVLALALCRMAARGDSAAARIADSRRRSTDGDTLAWDDPSMASMQ